MLQVFRLTFGFFSDKLRCLFEATKQTGSDNNRRQSTYPGAQHVTRVQGNPDLLISVVKTTL